MTSLSLTSTIKGSWRNAAITAAKKESVPVSWHKAQLACQRVSANVLLNIDAVLLNIDMVLLNIDTQHNAWREWVLS